MFSLANSFRFFTVLSQCSIMLVLFVKETLLNAKSLYDRVQWALNNNNNNNKCKTRAVTFLKAIKK